MTLRQFIMTGGAVAALATAGSAGAVTGSLGGGTGAFDTLSSAGLNGGSTATLTGGTVYNNDRPFADIPAAGIFGNSFLAAGPSSGQPATLTFTTGLNYLSFLWGSPDTYNRLSLTTSNGVFDFTAPSLGFSVTNGNQSFSQYVQFSADAGEQILAVSFANLPVSDAFEVANFTTSAVPEPAAWAMMIAGFGAMGGLLRRKASRIAVCYS